MTRAHENRDRPPRWPDVSDILAEIHRDKWRFSITCRSADDALKLMTLLLVGAIGGDAVSAAAPGPSQYVCWP